MNYLSFIQNLSKKESDAASLKKEKLLTKMLEITQHPPSPIGYYHDLKCTLEEYGISLEDFFFKICLTYLSKPVRTKEDTNIIYCYLFFMKDLTSLIKKQDEGHYNEYLQIIANHMGYEKLEKNKILMRFGDKGRKAYIILDGTVDILIKSPKKVKLREREYLYYIANLIKYKEYGLVNLVVNENFTTFPMYIDDDVFIKGNMNNNNNTNNNNNVNNKDLPEWAIKEDSDDEEDKDNKSIDDTTRKKRKTLTNKQKQQILNIPQSFFHLNTKNESFRDSKNTLNIKVSQLLNLLPKETNNNTYTNKTFTRSSSLNSNKSNHNNNSNSSATTNPNSNALGVMSSTIKREKDILNTASVPEYISRFDVVSPSISVPSSTPSSTTYDLTIYTYIKIISRSTGALFGEVALSDPLALRTATIITSTDCHFATLNKRSYNLSLKAGADKQLRQSLQFITSLKVFSDISVSTLNKRYFNNFSLKKVTKGSIIMKQGEKSTSISLLKEGVYEVSLFASLRELAKIVKYIYSKLHGKSSYISLIEKSERESERLMKENLKFAKYYTSKELIRVSEIQCPDLVGLDDYIDDNNEMMFTIECKSPKGELFKLSNHFYNEICCKDYTVKINEAEFLYKKYELHVKRLNTIRECKIESFFDYKSKKDIIQSKLKNDLKIEIMKNTNMKRKVETIKTVTKCFPPIINNNINNNEMKDNIDIKKIENINTHDKQLHKEQHIRKTPFNKRLLQISPTTNDSSNMNNTYNINKTYDKLITQGRNTKEVFTNTILNSANIDKYTITMPNLKTRKVINISNDIECFTYDDEDICEQNNMNMYRNYNTDVPPLVKNNRCITTQYNPNRKVNMNLITTNKLLMHLNSKVWMNDMIWENVRPNLNVPMLIKNKHNDKKVFSTGKPKRKHCLNLTDRNNINVKKIINQNKTIANGEGYFDTKRKKYSEERNKMYYKTTKRINLILGKK